MLIIQSANSGSISTPESWLNLDDVRIDPSWALRIPADMALRRRILPLCLVDNVVVVACQSTPDIGTQKLLANHLKQEYVTYRATEDSLHRAITRVYRRAGFEAAASSSANEKVPSDIAQLCDEILQAAVLRGASDIHLVPTASELLVHLRVDGKLELFRQLPPELHCSLISRLKVLAGMDIAEKRAAQDGRIVSHASEANQRVEMRVATLPTRHGERMTMRLLGLHSTNSSLESLGMRDNDLQLFKHATSCPHGLILLTGPTGSGKSTTLYVAIEHWLKQHRGNVITIEDPIEYEIAGASQVEVDTADKVNFSKALRSLLRHDPDVVLIGEIRDSETASTAVKAALTGHLVFSTLHTNNAVGVVTRLIDLGVEPFLVAATLRLAAAQRLVRKLCVHCRKERQLSSAEARLLRTPTLSGATVYDPVGCLYCAGRGYVGRTGLFELLPVTTELSELMAQGAKESQMQDWLQRQDQAAKASLAPPADYVATNVMPKSTSLLEDGIAKLLNGTSWPQEIIEAVLDWSA